jgi:hypothetical protein
MMLRGGVYNCRRQQLGALWGKGGGHGNVGGIVVQSPAAQQQRRPGQSVLLVTGTTGGAMGTGGGV